jgi:hypothetical protein
MPTRDAHDDRMVERGTSARCRLSPVHLEVEARWNEEWVMGEERGTRMVQQVHVRKDGTTKL